VYSAHKYAAGIASLIDGATATTIDGCHVSSLLFASNELKDDATFGGIVAVVSATCGADPVVKNCTFTGSFVFYPTRSGGFIGYANRAVDFNHCLFDPKETSLVDGCATYVRTAEGVTCSFKECYFTKVMGTEQGEAVFNEVSVPEGCSYRFVSEANAPFNGVNYYKSGAVIELTAPDDVAFDHWATNAGGCWISNPWQRSGLQTVRDIYRKPYFQIETSMPTAKLEREMDGTKYRYLYNFDYHYYLSDETVKAKGYQFDANGELYLLVGTTKVWVTAVVGWVPGDIPGDGAQIHNDLTGTGRDHSLTAVIAPNAFRGCTELQTLYFKDTDANNYNAATAFDFEIGDRAFADCPNLTEVKMMQYTTKGTNHWEALQPGQVTAVADSVFAGSPQACFTVDASQYQNYLSSQVWKPVNNRILIYGHTDVDMNVNGAQYSNMRNTAGEALKNDAAGHAALMETLRYWNADYRQFTASSLLTNADENIWYTQVVGVQPGSLDGGTMRIYNDPGSYYNYKTIALQSLGESKDVTAIEFWQTNGRSENSYTDLKMVIRNGALKGCSNLKELRLFYYCQDGDDHWENLGPTDVIPGNNIFGLPSDADLQDVAQEKWSEEIRASIPQDFKIIVSPDRYQEFLDDPNWSQYSSYITPQDFVPNSGKMDDFQLDGLTYGYMTSPGGIVQTSQTVSQDVSWWTAPRIALEVALYAMEFLDAYKAVAQLKAPANTQLEDIRALVKLDNSFSIYNKTTEYLKKFIESPAQKFMQELAANKPDDIARLVRLKVLNVQTLADGTKTFTWAPNYIELIEQSAVTEYSGVNSYINNALSHLSHEALLLARKAPRIPLPSALKQNLYYVGATALSTSVSAAGVISTACWGGSGSYDGDALHKGMRDNILANIHQVGIVGGGYVITTPQKNLVYHTYIKSVPDKEEVTIYAGTGKDQGRNNNARTMTMAKDAFRDKKSLKTISFYENTVQSDEAIPMLLTIPDSAFFGCTSLQTIDLRVKTKKSGTQALGPESFILAGDRVFAGIDSTKIRIVIDPSRKQDFLDSESWAPMKQFFVYEAAKPATQYTEYGGNYAYAYVNGTTQKVHKVGGHKIEHTVVTGADDKFLTEHQGALKLCNDIGEWNNFQLDAVAHSAFRGNQNLRVVNFTDLYGKGAFGNSYTDLEVTLQDSCFAYCANLKDLDLLYLVTDGDNHIDPIRPEQVKIGRGVLEGTTAKIKMMPQQVEWFEADTAWVKYKDRFMPCVIKPTDKGFKAALKDMAYYDMAHTGYDPSLWDDYIDLSRVADFSWLDGKFTAQKDKILSLADFRHFECVGMTALRSEWFKGLTHLSNIVLPKTIKEIGYRAFEGCSSLKEIELPANMTQIYADAFKGCTSLKTIVVRGTAPATLQANALPKNEGMKIYVPAASLAAYLTAWAEYKDYIVSDASYNNNKVVTLTEAGTLAEKLGLDVEWSYTGVVAGDEPRYLHGNYAKYDSLTISGPLNDLDLNVIRYLGGTESYERTHEATDGCLRYLNLYNARIVKDKNCKAFYLNLAELTGYIGWRDITDDDVLPEMLFWNCTSLETVILPKSLKKITSGIFNNCTALKRAAVTGGVKEYSTWESSYRMLSNPLGELVFLTDQHATTTAKEPWGASLQQVYAKQSQLGDYINDYSLLTIAQSIVAPFKDDKVMEALADKGEFFPSEYLVRESVEGIFNNGSVEDFDDFTNFQRVKRLDQTFMGAANLKRIALPAAVVYIGREAFVGCSKLDTIRVEGTVPAELAEDAFEDLPGDFSILVPRRYAKLYRTEWKQYADHIKADETYNEDKDILTVTVTEPNTLGKALGLELKTSYDRTATKLNLTGVRGDFSRISRLKVVGPIGALDIDLLRYMAGYAGWCFTRNYPGQLSYIDLYDANIVKDDYNYVLSTEVKDWHGTRNPGYSYVEDNELPYHAFLRAQNLQTLILPKTCKKVNARALQECEGMETLVLGDDMEDFNWNALDDNAMLTRMYILAKRKVEISTQFAVWRWLCNNYNPTFDAFYVRPSQYQHYLGDEAYTGSSWQRTNNISTGVFTDDESFCAFASHGAATQDELAAVTTVKGWFDQNTGVRNLAPLRLTSIDYLDKATLAPLKELEHIALPTTLYEMEEGLFSNAKHLRAVDFLLCDSTDVVVGLRDGGFARLGINTQQTLCYVPAAYGDTKETNVVVNQGGTLKATTFRMVDSLDYVVPYEFEAEAVENPRTLAASSIPYTVCVPYKMNVPAYARAYKLSSRDGNNLVFQEVKGELQAMYPYLLKVVGNKRLRKMSTTLNTSIQQTIPATGVATYGRQYDAPGYSIRGTFETIGNAEAAELGAYVLQSDGDWHPVTTVQSQVALKPFRAFLLPSARTSGARIGMTLVDDDATGIDTIETIDQDGTHRYYDLNGHELPGKPAQGVYIYNGKKYMMK